MTVPSTPPPDQSPGEIGGPKAIESDVTFRQSAPGTSFQSHLQGGGATQGAGQIGAPTPMSLARGGTALTAAQNITALAAQAKTMQDGLGVVSQQLNTPNLKLNRSQTHLLRNKLTDAQGHARAAAAKLGVETAPMAPPRQGGVLNRFLSYINDGQDQFVAVQKKLDELSTSKEGLDAASMMMIQSKMNLAQQEIEFCSTLLSKVVSSITTIMGIQI